MSKSKDSKIEKKDQGRGTGQQQPWQEGFNVEKESLLCRPKTSGRHFNKTGPIDRQRHYYIDPLDRIDLENVLSLVDNGKYFLFHAPRQTGKTTTLYALMDYLNKGNTYRCIYINVEASQAAMENVAEALKPILEDLADTALHLLDDSFLKDNWEKIYEKSGPNYALKNALSQWCKQSLKPVVLLVDEADALVGKTLVSFLRQLRDGYTRRPLAVPFPQSVVLCGLRDLTDYRLELQNEDSSLTYGSPFNIIEKSLRLGDFSLEEIELLLKQHTVDTGQQFSDQIFPLLWELTEGQPWLVNALANEVCFEQTEGRNRDTVISTDMIKKAKEDLISRRETHINYLAERLKEERLKRVIEPILTGSGEQEKTSSSDIEYALYLGLIKKSPQLRIANSIYREIIPPN